MDLFSYRKYAHAHKIASGMLVASSCASATQEHVGISKNMAYIDNWILIVGNISIIITL